MKGKLSPEKFVRLAVASLRLDNYKGIHSVFSGFNEAFKTYFVGANPIEATGEMALKKMGLLEKRRPSV